MSTGHMQVPLLRQILWAAGLVLAAAMMAVALVCLGNPHQPQLYLIDIFSVPILTGSVIATAALALLRLRWPAGLAAAACLVLLVAVWPQIAPRQATPDRKAQPVRLVFANLLIRNHEPERLLPWVETQDPDIVAVIETNMASRAKLLAGLTRTRPYVVTRYDMVVVSRWPLRQPRPRPPGFALMTVDVLAPGRPFTLAVTHLTRPWPFTDGEDQPRQFSRLVRSLGTETKSRLVLVGDFNTTPSASAMHDFTKGTGLNAAPALRGTWPSFLPSLLRVGIDNVLVSPDLVATERSVGGFTGSDHRPVSVDILPAEIN